MPFAAIFFPLRRSSVSSTPNTSGPSGAKASTNSSSRIRLASLLDQAARLKTR
jgi:hypothetical protein